LSTFQTPASLAFIQRPTKRAADGWESAAFSSIFLALGFFCSQAFSQPAHPPLTQAVGRLAHKQSIYFDMCNEIVK
jgi:hypothetical protein